MDTLEKSIEIFERVIITGTDYLMKEIALELPIFTKEVTKEQRDILIYIYVKGVASPGDISLYQDIKKSTLSNRLKKLRDSGYIEPLNSNHKDDKRYLYFQLTAKSTEYITKFNALISNLVEELFYDLENQEELRSFMKILMSVQQKINDKGGSSNEKI